MATVTKLHVSPQSMDYMNFKHYYRTGQPPVRPGFGRSQPMLDSINVLGKLKLCRGVCRSFRGEDGGRELGEKQLEEARKCGNLKENQVEYSPEKGNGFLSNLKSSILKVSRSNSKDEYRNAVAKLEEIFSSIAVQIGRYIVTMMSTGVILAVGFQLSCGDSQLNTLIWYSWLGGIIIGTMIGANMVLDEHCRAGPRNVVITGSTRGLGKALAREFLLSGDHVVVASRSPESVHMTVKELEENLKEGMISASGASMKNLAHAKVVGIACDVCEPDDVRKLANFAVNELGSIDILINNAGTNKGFRPLL
uniref:Chlorophyll b reductase n=1 Tax=Paeonia lactiflora TaxID=35924 RepID=A0A6C0X4L6_PAELC|nr:chlorophyll b reductase [Paeonia lactiflora]